MFEKFTDRTRKIMALANRAAHQRGTRIIGDMEMLLGLLEEGRGVGAQILRKSGLDLKQTYTELFGTRSLLSFFLPMKPLPQTQEAKRIIETAMSASASLEHDHVGSEHLLLAITMSANCAAAKALMERNVNETKVRQLIEQFPRNPQTNHVMVDESQRE
ncbi:MAG TPA: Clp protease N-terminal domain-containing protein [Tepidisphaeraceae bacterium]|nr:Clp protease N-terminal domain-containing protein [Tepidisphaeraceae bacterium]